MVKLSITRILETYDVPQLFVAKDINNHNFLCLLYNIADDGSLEYISVRTRERFLNNFICGHTDLRSMFVNLHSDDRIYSVVMDGDDVTANIFKGDISDSMLPDEGYVLDPSFLDCKSLAIS